MNLSINRPKYFLHFDAFKLQEDTQVLMIKKLKEMFDIQINQNETNRKHVSVPNILFEKNCSECSIINLINFVLQTPQELEYFSRLFTICTAVISELPLSDNDINFLSMIFQMQNDVFLVVDQNASNFFQAVLNSLSLPTEFLSSMLQMIQLQFFDVFSFNSDFITFVISFIHFYLLFPLSDECIYNNIKIISIIIQQNIFHQFTNDLISTILEITTLHSNWFIPFNNLGLLDFVVRCADSQITRTKSFLISIEYAKIQLPSLSIITAFASHVINCVNEDDLFYTVAAVFFGTCFKYEYVIEELLRVGVNLALEIIFNDGSYKSKEAAMEAFLVLIQNGNIQQKMLIVELGILPIFIQMIETNIGNHQMTERALDALRCVLQSFVACDKIENFVNEFAECSGYEILQSLTESENEVIAQKSICLLSVLE